MESLKVKKYQNVKAALYLHKYFFVLEKIIITYRISRQKKWGKIFFKKGITLKVTEDL